jgi:hypothetical protein
MGSKLLTIEMKLECECGETFWLRSWPSTTFNNIECAVCWDKANPAPEPKTSISNYELNFG